jgi:hypothetical protein
MIFSDGSITKITGKNLLFDMSNFVAYSKEVNCIFGGNAKNKRRNAQMR